MSLHSKMKKRKAARTRPGLQLRKKITKEAIEKGEISEETKQSFMKEHFNTVGINKFKQIMKEDAKAEADKVYRVVSTDINKSLETSKNIDKKIREIPLIIMGTNLHYANAFHSVEERINKRFPGLLPERKLILIDLDKKTLEQSQQKVLRKLESINKKLIKQQMKPPELPKEVRKFIKNIQRSKFTDSEALFLRRITKDKPTSLIENKHVQKILRETSPELVEQKLFKPLIDDILKEKKK